MREARRKLGVAEEPRNAFRPDPDTLQLFFKERAYAIDLILMAVTGMSTS